MKSTCKQHGSAYLQLLCISDRPPCDWYMTGHTMPSWISRSSHKKTKSKVKTVPHTKNNRDIHHVQQISSSSFAVVLQNFTASCSDELDVQRGLVVEQLHVDGDWLYVKDVDGKCGYIPQTYCYPLDRMRECHQLQEEKAEMAKAKARSLTINLEQIPDDTERHCRENLPSQSTSVSVRQQQDQHASSPNSTGCEPAADQHDSARAQRQDSTTTDGTATPINPLPTPTTGQTMAAPFLSSSASIDPTPPTAQPLTDAPRSRKAQNRKHPGSSVYHANSYKEAVTGDEKLYGLMAGFKQSDLQGMCTKHQPPGSERMVSMGGLGHFTTDLARIPDDVFVSQVRKPHGIFNCLEAYTPQYQGEIALRESELVIVLEMGRGEWAWVLTSDNHEGLVPKNRLSRYSAKKTCGLQYFSRLSSVGTQTELVLSGPVHELACSAGTSSGASSPARGTRRQRCAQLTSSKAVQTDSWLDVSPDWFKTVDSTNSSYACQPSPLISRTPTPALHSGSKPETPSGSKCHPPPQPQPHAQPQPQCSAETSTSASHKPTLHHEGDTVKPLGSSVEPISTSITSINLKRQIQQKPVLTAVHDYSPPPNAKNALSLHKGDILYIQPHMVQSSSWLWVYHSTQRSFGFVPKTSVAFVYLVQRQARHSGSIEIEV